MKTMLLVGLALALVQVSLASTSCKISEDTQFLDNGAWPTGVEGQERDTRPACTLSREDLFHDDELMASNFETPVEKLCAVGCASGYEQQNPANPNFYYGYCGRTTPNTYEVYPTLVCVQSATPNQCTCDHGTGASGGDCPSDGDAKCASCEAGYYLDGDACSVNQCTCSNGTPGTATTCPADGAAKCVACESGHSLAADECTADPCNPTQVFKSNFAVAGSISGATGTSVAVVCEEGYTGSGSVTCQPSGEFTALVCAAAECQAAEVADSSHATPGSITGVTGDSVAVTCDDGYTGSGDVTCQTDGYFSALVCELLPVDDEVDASDESADGEEDGNVEGNRPPRRGRDNEKEEGKSAAAAFSGVWTLLAALFWL